MDLSSVADLCQAAKVRLRVVDPEVHRPRILVDDKLPTAKSWDERDRPICIIAQSDLPGDFLELRVLEILAYGFFDYDARECLCFQNYFDRSSSLESYESIHSGVLPPMSAPLF